MAVIRRTVALFAMGACCFSWVEVYVWQHPVPLIEQRAFRVAPFDEVLYRYVQVVGIIKCRGGTSDCGAHIMAFFASSCFSVYWTDVLHSFEAK